MKGRMKMAEKRNGREKNKEKNWDKIKNTASLPSDWNAVSQAGL